MLRNVDVFVKPRHDLRTKSAKGGLITLIAGSTALLLFFAQLYSFIKGTTQHSLHLSESVAFSTTGRSRDRIQFDREGKMFLRIQVTFPHISCQNLELKLNGERLKVEDFVHHQVDRMQKVKPNKRELQLAGFDENHKSGCTVKGRMKVPIVAGQMSITLTPDAWRKAVNALMVGQRGGAQEFNKNQLNQFNMTHYIHKVHFGYKWSSDAYEPLFLRYHVMENRMGGIALENMQIKLIPTTYYGITGKRNYYQHSVITHTVQPETLVNSGLSILPGLAMNYDLSPLAVEQQVGRDNIFVFLSSLVSIVGGAFVTVGLLTGCLMHSASAVTKKMD